MPPFRFAPIGIDFYSFAEIRELNSLAESIDVTFTITRDEYIRAMRRLYRKRLRIGRDIVGGLIAVCVGLYLLKSTQQFVLAWLLIIAGAFLLVLVGYAILLLPSIIYRSQPKLKSEYQIQFRDDGIGFKTSEIDAQLQWTMYHSWLRDDEFYMLYHGTRDVSVIPRRAILHGADERLGVLLQRTIGPSQQ